MNKILNKKGQVSKVLVILVSLFAIALFLVIKYVGVKDNSMKLEEKVKFQSSQLDNQLKRKQDLIPNLVNTVKGAAKNEQEIIDNITSAREKMGSSSDLSEKLDASNSITKNLNLIVEKYPDIKSNENYRDLFVELAGTENRITIARKDYNNAVQDFNTYKNKTINSIFLGSKEDIQYLELSEEERNTEVIVDFNN